MHKRHSKRKGFTIVELLIVIVVIAILAAISIVAYTGIQARANNAATVNAASGSLKLIQAYIAQEGAYPWTRPTGEVYFCIVANSGCATSSGNPSPSAPAAFYSRMTSVGALPTRAPTADSRSGVFYFYHANAIAIDGNSQSAWLLYWLEGTNQDCGLSGVLSASSPLPITASSTNYSVGNDGGSGKTRCNILIPGPAHV